MTREIILDTETTGLDPANGDRIIEIAAVELINGSLTNNNYHQYINPERDIPDSAFRVHGISAEMVADKPKFVEIVEQFIGFIGDDVIVAHNAEFDLKFINSELQKIGRIPLSNDRVVDTLALARKKHPGSPNSLDALCTRYGVDRTRRVKHGALIDAEILAEVYVELTGGRQTSLSLQIRKEIRKVNWSGGLTERPRALASPFTAADAESHRQLVESLGAAALWRRYRDPADGV
ncbi:DNA polymerase III subunit epsilon [Rhodoblastus sp.]|uniref:DNA polymerase III subunit epsilon n=1 Tax=Rhodoblastus sp. TaxID=1962975 RepID=UPI0035B4BC28